MIKLMLYRQIGRRKGKSSKITTNYIYLQDVKSQDVIDKWNRLGKLSSKIVPELEWWYQIVAVHTITDNMPDPQLISTSIHDV